MPKHHEKTELEIIEEIEDLMRFLQTERVILLTSQCVTKTNLSDFEALGVMEYHKHRMLNSY